MKPILFHIFGLPVYGYGLMLALAFLISGYILAKEFKRKNLPDNYASEITLLAIIFGIIGSKLFHIFENWDEFTREGITFIFSPSGLTYYGGFLCAALAIAIYLRKRKIRFLDIADIVAPSLALAYGIGRLGCHLAGDGDYGIPTFSWFGVNYENGIVKPAQMFGDPLFQQRFPELAKQFPQGVLNNTPLHPTPVYEFLAALFLFGILWYYREKIIVPGKLFMLYLIIAGLSRFLVEMIRLNPIFIFNMTEAQFISVLMMIAGVWGLLRLKPKIASSGTEPSPIDSNASAKAKVNKDRNSRHKPKK